MLEPNPYVAPAQRPPEFVPRSFHSIFRAYFLAHIFRTAFAVVVQYLWRRMPDVEWQIISMGTSFVVACLETIAHWTILRRTRARILFLPIALTIVGYAYSAYVGPNEKSWQLSVLSALTSLATVAAYVSLPAAPSILRWFRWLALAKLLLLLTNAVGWVNAGETAASNLWMLAFPYFIFGVGHMALMFKVFWNLNLADLAQTPHNNK